MNIRGISKESSNVHDFNTIIPLIINTIIINDNTYMNCHHVSQWIHGSYIDFIMFMQSIEIKHTVVEDAYKTHFGFRTK